MYRMLPTSSFCLISYQTAIPMCIKSLVQSGEALFVCESKYQLLLLHLNSNFFNEKTKKENRIELIYYLIVLQRNE